MFLVQNSITHVLFSEENLAPNIRVEHSLNSGRIVSSNLYEPSVQLQSF